MARIWFAKGVQLARDVALSKEEALNRRRILPLPVLLHAALILQLSSTSFFPCTSAVATDAGGTSFAPVLQTSVAAGNATFLAVPPSTRAPGLFYTPSCTASGFTDPASGACSNASDPTSFDCALGAECSQCPSDALCPGEGRRWPRAGYFAFSEFDSTLLSCGVQGADAVAHCVGWDPVKAVTLCSPAYRQGSYLCDACADNCESSSWQSRDLRVQLGLSLQITPSATDHAKRVRETGRAGTSTRGC